MKTSIFKLFSILFLTIFLSACTSKTMTTQTFDQTDPIPKKGDAVVTMETNQGTITANIFLNDGGEIAKNFVELAKSGFYDGLIFHRVIPGFMIQGGDPLGSGFGGHSYKGEGTKVNDFFIKGASNIRGSFSMANSGPNTNGSQFFINQAENTFLNGKHAVFGQVTSGMDVVDLIANTPRDGMDKPLTDVVMTKVTVEIVE